MPLAMKHHPLVPCQPDDRHHQGPCGAAVGGAPTLSPVGAARPVATARVGEPGLARRRLLGAGMATGVGALGAFGALGAGLGWSAPAWGQGGPPPSEATAPALPAVGSTLALPTVTLFDGSVFTPQQVRGQVLVLYWWASTCPFCALQSPEMNKLWLAQQGKGEGKGLRMLALSVDRKPADALPYLQKRGYSFPSGWVTPEVQAVLPKPKGLPITVVVGRDGKVLQAERGQLFPEDVAQLAQWLG